MLFNYQKFEIRYISAAVFGLPIIVTIPRAGCTKRYLYNTILKQTSRYVIQETEKKEMMDSSGEDNATNNLFKLSVVNSYGSQVIRKLSENNKTFQLTS